MKASIEILKVINHNKNFPQEIVNKLGKKLFRIFCPDCKRNYCFTKITNFLEHQKKFHQERIIVPNQKNLEKKVERGKDKIVKIKKEKKIKEQPKLIDTKLKYFDLVKFNPVRTFYVDAARSIRNKEGKVYWKHSIVENNEKVDAFANSVVRNAVEAEAYTILKLVFYLIENKQKGNILVYCDNLSCCQTLENNICLKDKFDKSIYYLHLTQKLVKENGINLRVKWVKGSKNPADYYSRDSYRWHNPRRLGKKITNPISV